jgi:hypothetical protein
MERGHGGSSAIRVNDPAHRAAAVSSALTGLKQVRSRSFPAEPSTVQYDILFLLPRSSDTRI